jgi:hypothetical protein
MSKRPDTQVSIEDVDALIDTPGSVFRNELSGYAAAGVAVYLLEHWDDCSPSLTGQQKRADVNDVIAVLREWQRLL